MDPATRIFNNIKKTSLNPKKQRGFLIFLGLMYLDRVRMRDSWRDGRVRRRGGDDRGEGRDNFGWVHCVYGGEPYQDPRVYDRGCFVLFLKIFLWKEACLIIVIIGVIPIIGVIVVII